MTKKKPDAFAELLTKAAETADPMVAEWFKLLAAGDGAESAKPEEKREEEKE